MEGEGTSPETTSPDKLMTASTLQDGLSSISHSASAVELEKHSPEVLADSESRESKGGGQTAPGHFGPGDNPESLVRKFPFASSSELTQAYAGSPPSARKSMNNALNDAIMSLRMMSLYDTPSEPAYDDAVARRLSDAFGGDERKDENAAAVPSEGRSFAQRRKITALLITEPKIKQLARMLIADIMMPDLLRMTVENYKTVPSLSRQDLNMANAICTTLPASKIVYSSRLAEVNGYHLRSLSPTVWLTDEIVNGSFSLLLERARREEPMKSIRFGLKDATPNDTLLCKLLCKSSPNQTIVCKPPTLRRGLYKLASFSSSLRLFSGLSSDAQNELSTQPPGHVRLAHFFQSNRSLRSLSNARVHIYSSGFFQLFEDRMNPTKPLQYDYSRVRRWSQTQNVNILFLDKLIVPCHVNRNHWTLAVVNFREMRFEYYDSFLGTNKAALDCLRNYVVDEAQQHYQVTLDISSWPNVYMKDIPRQHNGCDCGVFTIMNADLISENRSPKDAYSESDMNLLRMRIALDLFKKRFE